MAWYHRLLNVLRPGAASRDLDREIAAHLAERADDLVAAGMSREESLPEWMMLAARPGEFRTPA